MPSPALGAGAFPSASECQMDIFEIIQELREERERVDRVIRSLEALMNGEEPREEGAPMRRGRKSMGQEERLQVSQRMRKYWEQRRKK